MSLPLLKVWLWAWPMPWCSYATDNGRRKLYFPKSIRDNMLSHSDVHLRLEVHPSRNISNRMLSTHSLSAKVYSVLYLLM